MIDARNCKLMTFGGFRHAGLGREGGVEGLDPYFELKTIHFG